MEEEVEKRCDTYFAGIVWKKNSFEKNERELEKNQNFISI